MDAHQNFRPPISLEVAWADILINFLYYPRSKPSTLHADHPMLASNGIANMRTMLNDGLWDSTRFSMNLDSEKGIGKEKRLQEFGCWDALAHT